MMIRFKLVLANHSQFLTKKYQIKYNFIYDTACSDSYVGQLQQLHLFEETYLFNVLIINDK